MTGVVMKRFSAVLFVVWIAALSLASEEWVGTCLEGKKIGSSSSQQIERGLNGGLCGNPVSDSPVFKDLSATARSTCVPTRMVSGMVYAQGRFFYHAWFEAFDEARGIGFLLHKARVASFGYLYQDRTGHNNEGVYVLSFGRGEV